MLRLLVFTEGFEGSNKGIKFSVRDSGGRGCVGGGEMDQAVGGGARGTGRETRGWVSMGTWKGVGGCWGWEMFDKVTL